RIRTAKRDARRRSLQYTGFGDRNLRVCDARIFEHRARNFGSQTFDQAKRRALDDPGNRFAQHRVVDSIFEFVAHRSGTKIGLNHQGDVKGLGRITLAGISAVTSERADAVDPDYVHPGGLQSRTIASATLATSIV